MLSVTDTHSAPLPSGLWYTLSITATSSELAQGLDLYLLVGGVRVYLPLALRASSGM